MQVYTNNLSNSAPLRQLKTASHLAENQQDIWFIHNENGFGSTFTIQSVNKTGVRETRALPRERFPLDV